MNRPPVLLVLLAAACSTAEVTSTPTLITMAPPPPAAAPAAVESRPTPAAIHFAPDQADIHYAVDAPTLDAVGDVLLTRPDRMVTVSGYADDRGSDAYNLELGERRAAAARDYLVRLGVGAERIRTVSYGRSRPIDTARDDAARARNRRDELEIEEPRAEVAR